MSQLSANDRKPFVVICLISLASALWFLLEGEHLYRGVVCLLIFASTAFVCLKSAGKQQWRSTHRHPTSPPIPERTSDRSPGASPQDYGAVMGQLFNRNGAGHYNHVGLDDEGPASANNPREAPSACAPGTPAQPATCVPQPGAKPPKN